LSEKWWVAPRIWEGGTAYIIGGGPSLKDFDFSPIHDKHTIGCNDAYALGPWVDICYFGDIAWFDMHWVRWVYYNKKQRIPGLLQYGGLIACCNEKFLNKDGSQKYKRVKVLKRYHEGIMTLPGCIAWNANTGASAINLAIILGCKRVVLLGFDMKLNEKGDGNYHINLKDKPKKESFARFMKYMPKVKAGADLLGVEIIQTTKDSALDIFPYKPLAEVV